MLGYHEPALSRLPGPMTRSADARPASPGDFPGGGDTTFKLIERVRAGDQAALEALFARYLVPLQRWASGRMPRWARDAADTQDLVQETLLQTFRKIESFEPRREGALQAYLRQALMNRIRDELRRFGRRGAPAALDSQAEDLAPSPLEHAIGRQATERYEQALSRLRPEDREAIIARVEMGYSYDELAQILGKPSISAARKAAERALVRLVAEMKRAQPAENPST
jgi:RNA polymerase sigma-70 factor (ECF subfamily)